MEVSGQEWMEEWKEITGDGSQGMDEGQWQELNGPWFRMEGGRSVGRERVSGQESMQVRGYELESESERDFCVTSLCFGNSLVIVYSLIQN